MEKLAQLLFSQSGSTTSTSRASQITGLHQTQMPNQSSDDYEEVECNLQELLNHYKFHPLNYFFVSDIVLLGKTDEFHLYSFYSNELEQKYILKVINNEQLYDVEKRICNKLEAAQATLKVVNAFTFEFPEEKQKDVKERQYYFIFEVYQQNMLQMITSKCSGKNNQEKYLTEIELREIIHELIEVFADLQRKRIAHRNIKPANIITLEQTQKSLRICNFELALELQEEDSIDFVVEAISIVYASPILLEQFAIQSKNKGQDGQTQPMKKYNPFKEDVFSLGLTLLQVALMCTSSDIKEIRQSKDIIKQVIMKNLDPYSNNIKCLLSIMLSWDSQDRPDFIQLEQILKDLFRMENCQDLLQRLTSRKGSYSSEINDSMNGLYTNLYQNVESFLSLKKQEVQESMKSTPTGSSPQQHNSKFHLHSSKLSCPIHDEMQFKYFCRQDQEFVCDECLEERHQEHEIEDLQVKCSDLQSQFQSNFNQTQEAIQTLNIKKSSIKSGKHIDLFFDLLIKDVLQLHQEVKEKSRQKVEENEIQQKYEKHCKKQETRFKSELQEIEQFIEQDRYAEAYTNLEYYEEQLRDMDKMKSNLSIYENLLENESQKLIHDPSSLSSLRTTIVDHIKDYINNNL